MLREALVLGGGGGVAVGGRGGASFGGDTIGVSLDLGVVPQALQPLPAPSQAVGVAWGGGGGGGGGGRVPGPPPPANYTASAVDCQQLDEDRCKR